MSYPSPVHKDCCMTSLQGYLCLSYLVHTGAYILSYTSTYWHSLHRLVKLDLEDTQHHWVTAQQNQQNDLCAQQRLRSAWASVQSDQSLCCPHEETWADLSLRCVHMSFCKFCCVAAHLLKTCLISRVIYFHHICKADIFVKINCCENLILILWLMRQAMEMQKTNRSELTFHQQNTKINHCELTFHHQNAKINSHENKQVYSSANKGCLTRKGILALSRDPCGARPPALCLKLPLVPFTVQADSKSSRSRWLS